MNDKRVSNLIGVFDSGVGGLSILREIHRQLPEADLLYIADQAHVPYGARSLAQVRNFAQAITRFLLSQGAGLIVVACNTASAAALHTLRQSFPEVPFVGMEPAVKPAAETTRTGKVGVLATPATFQGALYASVVERFGGGVTLLQDTCPGLVGQIEAGQLNGIETRRILEKALAPMLAAGIDTIVLGCTHYPFAAPLIGELAGPGVRIIDPSPAVARQTGRMLAVNSSGSSTDAGASSMVQIYTTASRQQLHAILPVFWPGPAATGELRWRGEALEIETSARA